MLCYTSSFKKRAGLSLIGLLFWVRRGNPLTFLAFGDAALLPCVCRNLVDHALHAQSRGAHKILCKIQDFTVAKDFSGEASCDGKVTWNRIGNTLYFKLLLWNSKRYPCRVRLQVSSKTRCGGHNLYSETEHRSSQPSLFSFGLLVNLVLNLGTTAVFELDFLPAVHKRSSCWAQLWQPGAARAGIWELQYTELQAS